MCTVSPSSPYHPSHLPKQAEAVPNQARTIAGSATTSILFQQTLALQEELMAKEKTIEDLKAGLMITCGALKQTNYMEPEVRSVDKVVLAFMTSVSCCALMCGMWSAQQLDNGRERLVNHLVKDWVEMGCC